MAKDPAFLFYSSDFLSGVTDLTMEERGQYITLLCLQHQKGPLSEKTIRLSVGSVSVDVLAKFSKDEQGNYINRRLEEEVQKRLEFTESRRNNGKLGGRPKANGKPSGYPLGKPYAKPNGKPKNNLPENENEDVIEGINTYGVHQEKKYVIITSGFVNDPKFRINGFDGIREYFELNQSVTPSDSIINSFLLSNAGNHFTDFKHLYNAIRKFTETNSVGQAYGR